MTNAQRSRFYFPRWRRCAAAHGWQMRGGRLAGTRLPRWEAPELNFLYQAVWDAAERLAAADHCAPTDAHFRYACHYVAVNAPKSSQDLTPAEIDWCVALFDLLAVPTDLDASERFDHRTECGPGCAWDRCPRRARLIWLCQDRASESYIASITRRTDGTTAWRTLSVNSLSNLCRILGERQKAWNRPVNAEVRDPAK